MSNPQCAYPNAAQGTFVTVGDEPMYAHPYPAQGYHQAPLVVVVAPPQQYAAPAAPPPGREPGFQQGCLAVLRCSLDALRCCDLINECCDLINGCCCDPSATLIG